MKKAIIAKRRLDAVNSIAASAEVIAQGLGIDTNLDAVMGNKDPELKNLFMLEAIELFMRQAGKAVLKLHTPNQKPAPPQGTPPAANEVPKPKAAPPKKAKGK